MRRSRSPRKAVQLPTRRAEDLHAVLSRIRASEATRAAQEAGIEPLELYRAVWLLEQRIKASKEPPGIQGE